MSIVKPKNPTPVDETATHFRAVERKDLGGFFITLYRYSEVHSKYGQTECQCTPELIARNSVCHFCVSEKCGIRPEYKGPMGWKFHTQETDPTPEDLHTINELYEVTGDKPDGSEFNNKNMYAGL